MRGVSKRFGATVALEPLDIELGAHDRGAMIGLLGPNGSGKSTLLRILVGLVPPDSGSVSVDGIPLEGDGTAIRARAATYAPGEIALYREMTGEQHLEWLLRGRERDALPRARAIAERLDLPLRARVRSYSHGMKRVVLLAAALAPRVPVRILDEPTEGLDPTRRAAVLELMREDADAGATVLLSSHHLGEVDRACERVVFLARGRLLADEDSTAVAVRARRLLRLGWDATDELARVRGALDELRVRGLVEAWTVEGSRARVTLGGDDPLPVLAALHTAGVPAPILVAHGELSLGELYREIYGEEGL